VWIPLCEETQLKELFAIIKDKGAAEQTKNLYDDFGAELYTTLWQPLEKELAGVKTVFYAASGLLHKIAFAAIPVTGNSGDKDRIRLGDRYDLNLVSSTREVVNRGKTKTVTPDYAVIYGGLEYNGTAEIMQEMARGYKTDERLASAPGRGFTPGSVEWPFLPGSESESLNIQQLLKGQHISTTLYAKQEGNEESFKNLDRSKTALLHLATHGFFLEDLEQEDRNLIQRLGGGSPNAGKNPLLRSGLMLSGSNNAWNGSPVEGVEDGILTADEIARLNLMGTELVVLSACQTGLGDVDNSEGVFGLQRAFKLAGVETLIMSLWKVDDYATSALMTVFYGEWLGGKSKQAAFKEAQRQVRAEYPQPFYWAAFVMMD
jgi:CHAT domain-containing protein